MDRLALIEQLRVALAGQPGVHAALLEGADAERRADAWSDIDLWFDVDEGALEAGFSVIEGVVAGYGPLDVRDEVAHPHPQIRQRFFRSSGLPPFCFVDACAQLHGREVTFSAHDAFLPLFDRGGVLKRAENEEFVDVHQRLEQLRRRRWRWVLVEKALQRGQRLEALAAYHREVLAPLVELLRLQCCPHKQDYGLKHADRDLPPDVVSLLEDLYSRTTPDRIRAGLELVERYVGGQAAEVSARPVP